MIDPVTLRWAEALWNQAGRAGRLKAVQADVARLGAALTPAVFDPQRERGQRRTLALAALGSADELTSNFVALAFDKHREDVLRALAAAFHRLDLDARNTVEGVVESARPLGADVLSAMAAQLGPALGKTVVLQNRIVPELVGGTRVIVANRMLDCSVAGRLEGLRRAMLEAPLGAAR